MSVKDRIDDAYTLWIEGRQEGAIALVLIAAAATARKRYPQPMPDNKSFKQFISDEMGTITGGIKYNVASPFRGKEKTPLEDIFYRHLRNQLVHEGEVPESITFTDPQVEGGNVYNILRLTDPLGFPKGWILNLAKAVREAPENREEFEQPS